ncbi:hypothetical protein [Burkholderia plantarii]|uniref:hypothetical protein n=1 Tax=Burkholderia plantarii TaxID=41899 RepID=UPI0018DD405D|nr:hypothetical protein [Burkholderia plantarii]MBI0326301.1 hypothetical protein [Burkholderia plantarii]
MILIDANVLLDLVTDDRRWGDRSRHQLEAASLQGPLAITTSSARNWRSATRGSNRSTRSSRARACASIRCRARRCSWLARRSSATGARAARKRACRPISSLARASMLGARLLTRDVGRYRTWFPKLALIAPED